MFGFGKKKPEPPPEKEVFAPIPPKPASGDQIFAVALHHELSKSSGGNLFFSPYSISTAFAMPSAIARTKKTVLAWRFHQRVRGAPVIWFPAALRWRRRAVR